MAEADFRAGQQVRVRSTADSEFAGHRGTIIYVGETVCDVKIVYRPKGSRRQAVYIGTFAKSDLEPMRRSLDLASYSDRSPVTTTGRRRWWPLVLLILTAIAWGLSHGWRHFHVP